MSDKLEQSKKDGPHALLASMVGDWEGVAKTWFEPDNLGDESPIKGTTRLVLDGLFLLHEYEGTLMGSAMKGLAIIAWSIGEQQWQVSWINSVHNGTRIMHSVGEKGAAEDKPNVKGSYPAGDGNTFDMEYYTSTHMPLLAEALGDAEQPAVSLFELGGGHLDLLVGGDPLEADARRQRTTRAEVVVLQVHRRQGKPCLRCGATGARS